MLFLIGLKFLKIQEVAEFENSEESGPSARIKLVFSDNPSQNIWDQFANSSKVGFYGIVDFVQFSSAFAKFLVL